MLIQRWRRERENGGEDGSWRTSGCSRGVCFGIVLTVCILLLLVNSAIDMGRSMNRKV